MLKDIKNLRFIEILIESDASWNSIQEEIHKGIKSVILKNQKVSIISVNRKYINRHEKSFLFEVFFKVKGKK